MKIYTSYFANSKKLAQAGIKVIGVALYPPRWFYGVSMKNVAPTASILYAKGQTHEQYTERYKREVLARVNPQQFMAQLRAYSNGQDVALCCFEKPGDFCHRHILAEWLSQTTGETIIEYGQPTTPPQPQPEQLSLF
ncbi:MAG: DUF488 domain-containing protein [Bacteroidaceae bacterium]|nr:DUF488 domain-containing protein [Bacteroidaceae bacterium]